MLFLVLALCPPSCEMTPGRFYIDPDEYFRGYFVPDFGEDFSISIYSRPPIHDSGQAISFEAAHGRRAIYCKIHQIKILGGPAPSDFSMSIAMARFVLEETHIPIVPPGLASPVYSIREAAQSVLTLPEAVAGLASVDLEVSTRCHAALEFMRKGE